MRKKRQPHRKFIITACEEDNRLSCEEAVRIAVEHFETGEYVEAEKGIWILWDSSGRAWAFQKKDMGFSMDTPYITYEDVAQSCGLVRKFWESGMQQEIELIPGPFDPKDGYGDIYHYDKLRIQYRG